MMPHICFQLRFKGLFRALFICGLFCLRGDLIDDSHSKMYRLTSSYKDNKHLIAQYINVCVSVVHNKNIFHVNEIVNVVWVNIFKLKINKDKDI